MNILIADDDHFYAKLIKEILDFEGHTSVIATDGMEAIQFASDTHFDVGIIDIFMPNKDGIEAIRDLKKMQPDIKLLAISGVNRPEIDYLKTVAMLGADLALAKPFTSAALIDLVTQLGGAAKG